GLIIGLAVIASSKNRQTFADDMTFGPQIIWNPDPEIIAGGNGDGSRSDQLSFPYGYYITKSGYVYACDCGNNRIQRYAANALAGETVVGGQSSESAQLDCPTSVYVDENQGLYVLDTHKYRVLYWPYNSTNWTRIYGGRNGNMTNQLYANQIGLSYSMTFDSSNRSFYLAESYANIRSRVTKWIVNGTSGVVVAGFYGQGAGSNELNNPYGTFIDENGTLFVADTYNHRVQKWPKNTVSATTIAGGQRAGTNASQLSLPTSVALDKYGNLYVLDAGNSRGF
ncbi:unnamed protein product, partial [Didymodactylos carnosus]